MDAAETQIKRVPYKFPKIEILKDMPVVFEDFKLTEYASHPIIKAPMVA
jgi:thymidylate synthase